MNPETHNTDPNQSPEDHEKLRLPWYATVDERDAAGEPQSGTAEPVTARVAAQSRRVAEAAGRVTRDGLDSALRASGTALGVVHRAVLAAGQAILVALAFVSQGVRRGSVHASRVTAPAFAATRRAIAPGLAFVLRVTAPARDALVRTLKPVVDPVLRAARAATDALRESADSGALAPARRAIQTSAQIVGRRLEALRNVLPADGPGLRSRRLQAGALVGVLGAATVFGVAQAAQRPESTVQAAQVGALAAGPHAGDQQSQARFLPSAPEPTQSSDGQVSTLSAPATKSQSSDKSKQDSSGDQSKSDQSGGDQSKSKDQSSSDKSKDQSKSEQSKDQTKSEQSGGDQSKSKDHSGDRSKKDSSDAKSEDQPTDCSKVTGADQMAVWINQADCILQQNGVPASKINADDERVIISHESGGNPHAINNWDSNAAKGTPSKGLMQTIDSTFDSYAVPGHHDIYNPVDNIAAAVKYSIDRYGSMDGVPGVAGIKGGGGYQGY